MSRFGPTLGTLAAAFAALLLAAPPAHAQISFNSAINLALSNSPQVKMAQADVAKARAALAETHDVYIPTVTGSTNAGGYAYGFPLSPPTVFSFSSSSLVFSYSQKDYIRAAEDGLRASDLALKDAREQVAQDTISTYFQLDRAQEDRAAMAQEEDYANRLAAIVKTRLDAGEDTPMDYTKARRTTVQIHLQMLQLDDAIATYEDHLGRITGLPGIHIATVPGSIPAVSSQQSGVAGETPDTPAVQAAFATAQQKLQQAFGDARYTWRPQVTFGAEYSRFSTFNNQYVVYYPTIKNLEENAVGFGLQITIPMFDAGHKAKARESMADAVHAQQQAVFARDQELEGRVKLVHSTAELAAREELASLDKDMAQEQLDAILVQLKATPSSSAPITPMDEQNARIQERQRFIDLVDATYQLRDAQLSLLRQTGQLETWLKSVAAADGAPPTSEDLIPPKMQISAPTPHQP
ncbi:MAG TPA: TolC family protein [Granulicella sp.]|jgi:outer membrane protein TolC|nr:TolC family protein [Granulicella sp.]